MASFPVETKCAECFCRKREDRSLYDPQSFSCTVSTPSGVETTYTYGVHDNFVRDAKGIFRVYYDVNESGTWRIHFQTGDTNAKGSAVILDVVVDPAGDVG